MTPEASARPPRAAADAAPTSPTAPAGPRGRASWSGLLRLSLVAVPVKAYPARRSAEIVHFHQLHAGCGQRLQYQKRCPVHGPVEAAAIARGYPYAPDRYVQVEPEELDQLRPAKDRALVLEHFLPAHQVDPALFAGRCLYLLPDGLGARHPYAVVTQTLTQSGAWALGRVVLSGSRQLVLVRPHGRLLALDLLHYPAAVRPAAAWQADGPDCAGSAEELRLAQMLVDAASGPLDWTQFRDRSAEELAALVEAKVAGLPRAAPQEEPAAVLRCLDALKQSVAAVREGPHAPLPTSRKPGSARRTGL